MLEELILISLNYKINSTTIPSILLIATKYVGHGCFVVQISPEQKLLTYVIPNLQGNVTIWSSTCFKNLQELPTKENDLFKACYNPPLCFK